MMGEVATSKSDLLKEHREYKEKYLALRAGNPDKDHYRMKMQKIEDMLKSDKFHLMFNDEMQRNPEIHKPHPFTNK
jgi:hypothetical protein